MSYISSLFRKLRRKARRSRLMALVIPLTVLCILISPFYVIYKPPALLIRYFQHRWPNVLWRVSTSAKVIALTIDDAPSEYADEILQILKTNDATATFFIIGSQVEGHEDMLQKMIRNGNELANHAMHDEPTRSLTDVALVDQVLTVDGILNKAYAATDVEPPSKYFRPGSGFFSKRMLNVLKNLGYQLVLGNVYPHDPQIPFWRINARHILSMIRPGAIVICHDRRRWTVPMLRKVVPEMKRRGYRVVTVTELLKEEKTGSS